MTIDNIIGTYIYYYRLDHKRFFCDYGYDYEGVIIQKKDDNIKIFTKYLSNDMYTYDKNDEVICFNETDLYRNHDMVVNIAKISLSLHYLQNNKNIKNILCRDLINLISEFVYNDFRMVNAHTNTTYFEIYDFSKPSKNVELYRSDTKTMNLLDGYN
tara:strand:+ start:15 stop:485 length:471 start_codon:yes stop_codon:yes gene_type:complete